MKPPTDMWDVLAECVPEARRVIYWRSVVRIRKLMPDDEVLILVEAMGVLALVTSETPKLLAAERAEWNAHIAEIRIEMERLAKETASHAVTAGNSTARAAESLGKITAVVIDRAEVVRNGLLNAGQNVNAQAISDEVARRLEIRLIEPAEKAVKTLTATVAELPGFAKHARETMEFLKNFNITWHYVNGIIMGVTLAILLPALFKGCAR